MLLEFCSCRQLCTPQLRTLRQLCTLRWLCTLRKLCATQSCAPWDSCAPGRAVCHAASCVPCEHWDSLLTTVRPEDSCVPCGQLCAIQTAVLPADSCTHCRQLYALQATVCTAGSWATEEPSAHHHLTVCQCTGMPAKLLGRVLSTSFLSEWAGLASTSYQIALKGDSMSSIWWKKFKEQHQKLLWLQIREDGDVWKRCPHERVLLHSLNKSISDQYSLVSKGCIPPSLNIRQLS